MLCIKCGMKNPNESCFCQYCGTNLSNITEEEKNDKNIDELLAELNQNLEYDLREGNSTDFSKKDLIKKGLITVKDTRKNKKIVSLICLILFLVFSISFNIYQYIERENMSSQLSTEQLSQIKRLNSTIAEKDKYLRIRNDEIATLKNKNFYLELNEKKYFALVDALKTENLGYASDDFYASESIIVIDKDENNRKFILNTNFGNRNNIHVDYNDIFSAAYILFEKNWSTSNSILIKPSHTGVTVVTFSNSINNQKFNVIIIVEE